MFDSVIQLEKSLLDPINRTNLLILDSLLHDEFVEFGSSGKVYNKQDILKRLPHEQHRMLEVESTSITTRKFSDDCILLTYNLIFDSELHSRRSSIWIKNLDKWQLVFHQGTPY